MQGGLNALFNDQKKACIPVMARPKIRPFDEISFTSTDI